MRFHITYKHRNGAIGTMVVGVTDSPYVPQSKLRAQAITTACARIGISRSQVLSAVAVDGRPAMGRRS